MVGEEKEPDPPRGFHQFEGLAPDGSGRAFFVIAKDALLKHFKDTGNKRMLMRGFAIPEVRDKPTGVWQDLQRPEQEKTYCFAGLPSGTYHNATIQLPCPPGQVFVVYVSGIPLKEGQLKVLKWNWVEEDPKQKGFPIDHDSRFGKRLWPHN